MERFRQKKINFLSSYFCHVYLSECVPLRVGKTTQGVDPTTTSTNSNPKSDTKSARQNRKLPNQERSKRAVKTNQQTSDGSRIAKKKTPGSSNVIIPVTQSIDI